MTIFFTILIKLIPLYLMILLGYIASRRLSAQKETVAKMLIYIIAPAVIFYGAYTTPISAAYLSLPILFYILCSLLCLLFLAIGTWIYKRDTTKNILAFTAGTGNTGYFGLPVISAVLGEQAFSIAVLSILGFVLYENTIGFFITARGNFTARQSVLKVAKLPTIYAFAVGLTLNLLHVQLGEIAVTTIGQFKGAYTLLGMMIIGMGLASVSIKNIDTKFLSLTFFAKFCVWPILMGSLILLDQHTLQFYSPAIHNVMLVMSIVPLAANTVALATELKTHPEKAAVAVLLSTLFALFFIPLINMLFIA